MIKWYNNIYNYGLIRLFKIKDWLFVLWNHTLNWKTWRAEENQWIILDVNKWKNRYEDVTQCNIIGARTTETTNRQAT